MAELSVRRTTIPGLLVVDIPVHADNRGWFKENWQREKMVGLGLPDFGPVQNNISYSPRAGATRGIHAEPWDKLVSVASGRIFGAWVDLRDGPTFGEVFTSEMGPGRAVFVPRGVGNAFQTLVDGTAYAYLVNDHWSAEARAAYRFVNLADETLGIDWPIPLGRAELSAADREHPGLSHTVPFLPRRTLVIGGDGQLGRELRRLIPTADATDRSLLDLADEASFGKVTWGDYDTVVNAAAYTAVDAAETEEGRRIAWEVNAAAVGRLADLARAHGLTLVHISSDYVFDGTVPVHTEDEAFSPLGVYGQSKAAGDLLAAKAPRHYIVRTSWVIGEGRNFVRTMVDLADKGAAPSVVDDQHGRLTFGRDLARGIAHLLDSHAPFGTYNLSGSGDVVAWCDIARTVFASRGRSAADVTGVSTAEYGEGRSLAPRPRSSVLDIAKIEATGFAALDGDVGLAQYLEGIGAPAG